MVIYDNGMVDDYNKSLPQTLRHRRVSLSLTLRELAASSGVSKSHLTRIERAERLPSAHVLRKIAEPLGFEEDKLFMLAGFLSHKSPVIPKKDALYSSMGLDRYVATVLSQESVETQHAVIAILIILRSIAKSIEEE